MNSPNLSPTRSAPTRPMPQSAAGSQSRRCNDSVSQSVPTAALGGSTRCCRRRRERTKVSGGRSLFRRGDNGDPQPYNGGESVWGVVCSPCPLSSMSQPNPGPRRRKTFYEQLPVYEPTETERARDALRTDGFALLRGVVSPPLAHAARGTSGSASTSTTSRWSGRSRACPTGSTCRCSCAPPTST